MGIGDVLTGVGNSISNGVSAVGDAAGRAYDYSSRQVGRAYDYTAQQAQAGYEAARRTASRGALWVSDTYATTSDFFGGYPENEQFPVQINYEVFDRAGPPMPASGAWSATGGPSTLSPAERSFLYLDVGRWGGSQFYPSARDFGIVCGRTAVLCAFKTDKGSASPIPNTYNRPEVDHINALLAHLGTGSLGKVKVRRYDTARTLLPGNADVNPDRIFVIVGDMHLPVITNMRDTHGARMGRIPGRDDRDTPEQWIPTGEGPVIHIPAHTSNGGMVEQDAIDWYRAFNGANAAGVHEHKGADIFEEAGPDLSELTRLLNAFSAFPLHLLQLGDMVDLWIGLERFFVEHPSRVVLDTSKQNPDPVTWINHWTDRTLNGTSQSDHVKRFLAFSNGHKNWLYGNHDNYLAAHNPTVLTQASGGLNRQETFDERQTRLFASHGHKWDSSNRDGATRGQAITQLAFSHPSVRSVEPGGRRATITGAVELFLSREANPFCVFAMGHTHVGILTRVTVLNRT
ncbi:Hypothetical protein A7982_02985 [Minicystis rosea]|nr:Hypothetical protein A7982_02985 [Minicystis rosea]